MKTCFRCKEEKELSEFYNRSDTGKAVSSCKQCWKIGNNQKTRDRRAELWLEKSHPCVDCHKTYPPYVMDFDHVRGQKIMHIGTMISRTKIPWADVLIEISKCDLVCANCHRERTHNRR